MKESKQCPKCKSLKIGHLPRQLDRSGKFDMAFPRMVGTVGKHGWILSNAEKTGLMEAYVCTECGYFESYVVSPESVPFEELEGFRWVNAEPTEEGPYR